MLPAAASFRLIVLIVRAFRRAPGFFLLAVLTLAVGIGATTAIFTVINAVLLHRAPEYGHQPGAPVGPVRRPVVPLRNEIVGDVQLVGPGRQGSIALPRFSSRRGLATCAVGGSSSRRAGERQNRILALRQISQETAEVSLDVRDWPRGQPSRPL